MFLGRFVAQVLARFNPKNIEIVAQYTLLASILVLVLGVTSFLDSKNQSAPLDKTSLTERDMAIQNALSSNTQTYSFDTKFIPGIGYIDNPQQYLKDWEQKNKTD